MTSSGRFTTPERGWIMYDWANSAYYTVLIAAIFPIYFSGIAPDGDIWWGYGTSLATLVMAVFAPVLGAVADYAGMKKKLFSVCLAVGAAFTVTMAIFDDWRLILVGYVVSYIGIMGTILFYDSFLTDITTPERMDRVSAAGYAMGYIGGSTIPFLVSIAMVMLMEDGALAVKLSVVLTVVWWAVFSIPFLKNVSQTHSLGSLPRGFVRDAFQNIGHTVADMFKRRGLLLFMIAYFFYIDGVNTVIHMSTVYGAVLGLNSTGMILALLVTQIVAAPCSMLFARLSKTVGSIKMLIGSVCIYFVICLVGFYMGFSLESPQFAAEAAYTEAFDSAFASAARDMTEDELKLREEGLGLLGRASRKEDVFAAIDRSGVGPGMADTLKISLAPALDNITASGEFDAALARSNILFWCMAVLVGTCQGGIQSLSRSYFGKLIPPEKSNEYFGFFNIFGKFAAVIGPALYSAIAGATGRPSSGILSLMILFLAGGIILVAGQRHFRASERS